MALLLALSLITGCEKNERTKVATQVAAKVNADEITVHQVNNILALRNDVKPEVAARTKRAILEKLINQQLASQKAIEAQLDRSPKVMQAIESAKTEILTRAYIEGITRTLPKPTPWEIQDYYSKHPELFAQRRIFAFEEIAFVANGNVAVELRKQLSKPSSLKEITDWLQSQGIKFAANRGVRAAEQIPLEMLPKLQAMKKGEIQLFERSSGRFQVIRLADFLAAPVDKANATPLIQQFLFNQRSGKAIAKEMNEIRNQAKIEYMGEFADDATAVEAKEMEAARVKDPTKAESKAVVEAQPESEALIKGQPQK